MAHECVAPVLVPRAIAGLRHALNLAAGTTSLASMPQRSASW
jgi:hypothetical protein